MNYAVIEVANGNFTVASEHGDNKQGGYVAYLNLCSALWGDTSAIEATVKLVDEKLDTVDGFQMEISHPAKE